MKIIVSLIICLVLGCGRIAMAGESTLSYGRFGTISLYQEKPHPVNLILFVSGDGGWNQGVVDMARELAGMDALVAGIDVDQALLVGYSLGADVWPFAVNRLSKAIRDQVKGVALLAPGRQAAFEFHLSNWMGGGKADTYPTQPEVERISGPSVLCLYGGTKMDSLCPLLDAGRVKVMELKGGHHLGGDYEPLIQAIVAQTAQ